MSAPQLSQMMSAITKRAADIDKVVSTNVHKDFLFDYYFLTYVEQVCIQTGPRFGSLRLGSCSDWYADVQYKILDQFPSP